MDGIFARVYKHSDLIELDAHSSVPVINGLSEVYHPLQALADFLTMMVSVFFEEKQFIPCAVLLQ